MPVLPAVAVALLAQPHWPAQDAAVMVAIAWAESGLNSTAQGDHYTLFPPIDQPLYLAYACDGFTSFGFWQINQRWHYPKLRAATGSNDPCVWRNWLWTPENNAAMAKQIWDGAGFSAWSTFNGGQYLVYLDQARDAVNDAWQRIGLPPPLAPPPAFGVPGPFPLAAFDQLAPVEPPFASVEPPLTPIEPPA